jgi:hypothetical protein
MCIPVSYDIDDTPYGYLLPEAIERPHTPIFSEPLPNTYGLNDIPHHPLPLESDDLRIMFPDLFSTTTYASDDVPYVALPFEADERPHTPMSSEPLSTTYTSDHVPRVTPLSEDVRRLLILMFPELLSPTFASGNVNTATTFDSVSRNTGWADSTELSAEESPLGNRHQSQHGGNRTEEQGGRDDNVDRQSSRQHLQDESPEVEGDYPAPQQHEQVSSLNNYTEPNSTSRYDRYFDVDGLIMAASSIAAPLRGLTFYPVSVPNIPSNLHSLYPSPAREG